MRPVTSACALMTFQLSNCGAASTDETFSTKAFLSIGANTPERFRLLVITPEICAPSVGSAPPKSVIAIGMRLEVAAVDGDRESRPGRARQQDAPAIAARRRRASPCERARKARGAEGRKHRAGHLWEDLGEQQGAGPAMSDAIG